MYFYIRITFLFLICFRTNDDGKTVLGVLELKENEGDEDNNIDSTRQESVAAINSQVWLIAMSFNRNY